MEGYFCTLEKWDLYKKDAGIINKTRNISMGILVFKLFLSVSQENVHATLS